MNTQESMWRAVALLLLATARPALTQTQLTIDDFTNAPQELTVTSGDKSNYKKANSNTCDPLSSRSSQSPIGCARSIRFVVAPTKGFAQPARLEIGGGLLLVDSSIRVSPVVQVFYGVNEQNQQVPLNLNLSGFNRFRVHVDSNDLDLIIAMQVIAGNNPSPALGEVSAFGTPTGTPFPVDLPFSSFAVNAGPAPDFRDIDQIRLFVQTASAIGANDYAIASIEALP